MEKWRKTLSLALLSVGLLSTLPSPVNAGNDCCDPCCEISGCGFEAGVEFLWWKPCIDDLDYAASFKDNDGGGRDYSYHAVCSSWAPGVRVTLGSPDFFCDWHLGVSYTYLRATDSNGFTSATDGVLVTSPVIHPGVLTSADFTVASGSYETTYQDWDILFAHELHSKGCHHFSPFFGIAGIHVQQDFNVSVTRPHTDQAAGERDQAFWDSKYYGVGLKAGSEYQYRVNDCMRLYGKGSATLLAGQANNNYRAEVVSINTEGVDADPTNVYRFNDDKVCQLVPGYHIDMGLLYDSSWCNTDFSVKVGYEFKQWHNLPNHRHFADDDDANNFAHSGLADHRTYGFHGLNVGVNFSF